jgi:hypothetical protein
MLVCSDDVFANVPMATTRFFYVCHFDDNYRRRLAISQRAVWIPAPLLVSYDCCLLPNFWLRGACLFCCAWPSFFIHYITVREEGVKGRNSFSPHIFQSCSRGTNIYFICPIHSLFTSSGGRLQSCAIRGVIGLKHILRHHLRTRCSLRSLETRRISISLQNPDGLWVHGWTICSLWGL